MVTRPAVIAVICVGVFLVLQALIPKAMALRNPSNEDRFMTEGHRTQKRNNYMVQRASDEEMGRIDNDIAYGVEPYDPDRNPEELSAFIVDYANMIRNDVILLDKSVETRTRKRGNIKYTGSSQVISEPDCSCVPNNISKVLGKDIFPQEIEVRQCSEHNSCRNPYVCNENRYNITILKKRDRTIGSMPEDKEIRIHDERNRWNSYTVALLEISVGCTCITDFTKMKNLP